jgi:hypothetical protein
MIHKKPLFVAMFIIAAMTTAIARGQIQSIQKPPQQQKVQTTQYANSGAKNFAISLDRIPASKRAQVFNGQHFYRADVIVKAHYADNGRTGFVEDKYNIAIAPPSLDGIFK